MAEMPEIFSEGNIDLQKLKAALGEAVFAESERYGLSWTGKADCFKKIQETTTNTLRPCREEPVDFDATKNLFIEGDNSAGVESAAEKLLRPDKDDLHRSAV